MDLNPYSLAVEDIRRMHKLIKNVDLVPRMIANLGFLMAINMAVPSIALFIKDPRWGDIFAIGIVGSIFISILMIICEIQNCLLPNKNGIVVKFVFSLTLVIIYAAIILYSIPLMGTEWRDVIQRGSTFLAITTYMALRYIWSTQMRCNSL